MKKIMLVFGTRPEAIKMCPLVKTLDNEKNIETVVCVTGQHKEMLQQVLDVFDVQPKYNLKIMKEGQDLYSITSDILIQIKPLLELEKPDIVLVHGDTSTTFATALASFYMQIPVGHVEAGLRTHNIYSPFPEEFNRLAVGNIATYNFCPTELAKENLLRENKNEESIVVTGNTAIDALKTTVNPDYHHDLFEWIGDKRLIMLTVHRRENLGNPMRNMFRAINRVCEENDDIRVIYPIHLNPQIRKIASEELKDNNNIKIVEPFEVTDFHNFLAKSYLILTDSGGIQEEAPSLGKPVLVLRDTTERPEGVNAGTLKLVGHKEENIYQTFMELLNDSNSYKKMSQASNPYGDGFASERIKDFLNKNI
ncbi:UDP-N-acetylglucosamine 2-epimerase (non-hydrolyzing) [Enterococcus saccharolyticus]|uniref:non-hydrolyzing UDP-N-acetylglucosamine 2-epimerase n=1 Tax=Enterococcus saccharolyticus TaxID=41997 RepID=UPI001E64D612|nr:UDP-N-acetylglucosamine 2-epimerase (non-hydrolyzing) [Enterococcus saccharolyticus]MCD5001690.1 UDP-N-acetylglucosamine 2-epimerase (non-hydrolyzing) [Enterococcus saccharolyticus]